MNPASFRVYFDATKKTSGQRFFTQLSQRLAQDSRCSDAADSGVTLFNISAPLKAIALNRLRGRKTVLRVDGLYFDRLSPAFLRRFGWPLRTLLSAMAARPGLRDLAADIANLLHQNWTGFARIVLADFIIYQSQYSRRVHARYFAHKPHTVIVNGSGFCADVDALQLHATPPELQLVTIFDDWKPAKRLDDIIEFVRWANESAGAAVHLTILGYNGKFPASSAPGLAALVESRPYFRVLPKFKAFEGDISRELLGADMYISFSYRDPCPNVVVESMAHGLPVLGVASGGLPDIVGDAGILLPDGDSGAFFTAACYERDFPPIEFERVLDAARRIKQELPAYRARVRRRFETDLDMAVVAGRYLRAIESVA